MLSRGHCCKLKHSFNGLRNVALKRLVGSKAGYRMFPNLIEKRIRRIDDALADGEYENLSEILKYDPLNIVSSNIGLIS